MGESDEELAEALFMARALFEAAEEVARLTYGGADVNHFSIGGEGRAADQEVAIRDWVGTTKDDFVTKLYANEYDLARRAERRLEAEADAWAATWADAVNARNERHHSLAMRDHEAAEARHQEQLNMFNTDLLISGIGLAPPAPIPPPRAVAPSAPRYVEIYV